MFVGSETYYDDYYWLAVRDNDYVMGEFLWAGFDYLRKSFWSNEPVAIIEPYRQKYLKQIGL